MGGEFTCKLLGHLADSLIQWDGLMETIRWDGWKGAYAYAMPAKVRRGGQTVLKVRAEDSSYLTSRCGPDGARGMVCMSIMALLGCGCTPVAPWPASCQDVVRFGALTRRV